MLIEPKDVYKKPLADLWHDVFGDEYGYINLLFDSDFYVCDTFVKEYDGEIVSALYLLGCNIDFEGKKYVGRYLYAAATRQEHRGKGIMGELIKEAQNYCKKNNFDFISLVPASERLYNYYSGFGFQTAMHRYETEIKDLSCGDKCNLTEISSAFEIEEIRKLFDINKFYYQKEDMKYAFECMADTGCKFYRLSHDGYFITDNSNTIYEFLSSDVNLHSNVKNMLSQFEGNIKIYSPYDMGDYGQSEPVKFGMIYPINEELKRNWKYTDIYMNLALN